LRDNGVSLQPRARGQARARRIAAISAGRLLLESARCSKSLKKGKKETDLERRLPRSEAIRFSFSRDLFSPLPRISNLQRVEAATRDEESAQTCRSVLVQR